MFLQIHQREPGGVPDFIGEPFACLNLRFKQRDIRIWCAGNRQGKPERIGAVGGNRLKRIDDIPLGFAHLLSLLISNEAVQIDGAERHLVQTPEPEHHHACHPKKEDIPTGDENRSRIEGVELHSFFGPPHRGERPEAGAEPHV